MGHKLLRKRFGCLFLAGILLLGTVGCGASEEPDSGGNQGSVLTGEMVPVAEYQEVKYDLSSLDHYEWQGDHLLYLESVWNEERKITLSTLYQVNTDGTGVPEALYTGTGDGYSVWHFTLGADDSLYFLERKREENGIGYYLRKLDSDFQEVYLQSLEEVFGQAEAGQPNVPVSISGMYADNSGNLLMIDYSGKAYFFDREGKYIGCDTNADELFRSKLVDAGEQGCFFVRQGSSASNYLFQKIDFETGRLGAAESRDLSGATMSNISVLSGYDLGVLVSTENRLCSYHYGTGEFVELFNWGKINVDGTTVQEIRFLQKDFPVENLGGYTEASAQQTRGGMDTGNSPEALPVLEALSYSSSFGNSQAPEIVRVGYLDKGEIPEKQTVTLGLAYISTLRLGEIVRRFNRSSKDYEIVIRDYQDTTAFTEELMLHPSEIPDILETNGLSTDMLESKGLLEDLKPYFQKSDAVGELDILEAVWEACEGDGKMTSMITGFSVLSLATTADTIPTDGWTYDQLFGLSGDYPDSKLLPVYTPMAVWGLVSRTLGSYIDWENGTCRFDSPEFIRLLENIRSLPYPENQEIQTVFYSEEEMRKFLEKEFLLRYDNYSSPFDYGIQYAEYEDMALDVGFPTEDGEHCFLMRPVMRFSIYSNSLNKEGAWAFLEFALSEEQQSWYGSELGGFPVRKSAFEAYLKKPHHPIYNTEKDYASEETAQMIREVMEHLYLEESMASGEISIIIREEIQAYFAGDKTVEQCVEIIQNRVQLYLDENF